MVRTLLVVDDDNRESGRLSPALREQRPDFDVLQSHSADEAWAVLSAHPIDVVLVDVTGTENAGMKLLERMAAEGMLTDVPVVILAGEGDEAARKRALAIGAGEVIGKPVDLRDLAARIHGIVTAAGGPKSTDEVEEAVLIRTGELERSRLALVIRLAKIAEMKDDSTGNHVVRVGCYAEELAGHLGLDAEFRKRILLAAPMHDLGKLAIPEAILLKPSPLNRDEWAVMHGHCELGAKMLREEPDLLARVMTSCIHFSARETGPDPILATAADIALCHHERWDGKGYPHGLRAEAIPLEARIVALVDAFDALTTSHPYRPAVPDDVALEVLMADQGTHFDPVVFDAFVECFPRIKAIHRALAG